MSAIVFEGLAKSYRGRAAIRDLTLEVESQSLTVLCGPPKSGKSVLLRILIGLEMPDAGRILIDGQDVTHMPAAERRIGYVPQSFALFPHMSVYDNIAYPLRQQGVPPARIRTRIDHVAEILRIGPLLGNRPDQLSGGEKQRTAIARGTLKDARIFVMDDPLVGLDFKLRESLMDDFRDMRAALEATFLYATSDSLEALTVGDQLAVIDAGRVTQAGPVDRVYHDPSTARSAELIGFPRCNQFPAMASNGICRSAVGNFPVSGDLAAKLILAVRPEDVIHCTEPGPAAIGGAGRIALLENLGAECVIYFEFGGVTLVSVLPTDAAIGLDVGDNYDFMISVSRIMIFDGEKGVRLRQVRETVHG